MLTILIRREPRVYHIRTSGRLTLIDRRAGDTVDGITVFLIFAIPISLYVVSLKLNPWVKCSKCKNKQKIKGWVAATHTTSAPSARALGKNFGLAGSSSSGSRCPHTNADAVAFSSSCCPRAPSTVDQSCSTSIGWVKERRECWGRVRGADGRQRWIRAVDLRSAERG
jgi:hypothetical protein